MADFIVLGAGMVGVSTALALQAQGHKVALVDKKAPGQETSYGNAGIIQAEAAEPYALPRDFPTLANFMFGLTNHVTWTASGVLKMAPALWSYFRHSSASRHQAISNLYTQLTSRSTGDHQPLIEASNSQSLIKQDGYALLFREEKEFDEAAQRAQRFAHQYGVTSRVLAGKDYQAEEPALLQTPAGVVHFTQSWTCASPGELTQAYSQLFVERGGEILTGEAYSLQPQPNGWSVNTMSGEIQAEQVVVALGPWSPELLKRFGYNIPMIYKRGYHGHYQSSKTLKRPFLDAANGVLAAPMKQGVRVTTGASLVSLDAPIDTRQLDYGVNALSDMLALEERVSEPQWYGARPCMPDMLPMVGEAPRHKGMWFHFGHGHQGFTLGPTTAALLVDAMAGKDDALLKALSPKRAFL